MGKQLKFAFIKWWKKLQVSKKVNIKVNMYVCETLCKEFGLNCADTVHSARMSLKTQKN